MAQDFPYEPGHVYGDFVDIRFGPAALPIGSISYYMASFFPHFEDICTEHNTYLETHMDHCLMEDYLELCFDEIGKVPENATVEEFASSWLDKIEEKFKPPVFNRLLKITNAWTTNDLRVRADSHFGGN